MSRLADILSGMDRGASPPVGVGGIPGLALPEARRRKWRKAPYLVMLAAMAALAAVLSLRLQSSAPPMPPQPVAAPAPAPTRARPEPSPSAALVRHGLEAAQNGAVGEAAGLFRKALAIDERDAETWNNLGVVLARQGSWTEGLEAFRRAVRIEPRHAEAHRNLAVALDRRGRSAEAIVHYRAFLGHGAEGHPDRDRARARLDDLTGAPSAGASARR